MTDWDPAAAFRGYRTRPEAEALLSANGGVRGLISLCLASREQVPIAKAQRGDVVLAEGPLGEGAGVIALDGRLALMGRDGVVLLPRIGWRAWRI